MPQELGVGIVRMAHREFAEEGNFLPQRRAGE